MKISDSESGFVYFLRVCGPLSSQASCTAISANSSACRISPDSADATVDVGDWSTQQWSFLNNDPQQGIMYALEGAPQCFNGRYFIPYYSHVMVRKPQGKG